MASPKVDYTTALVDLNKDDMGIKAEQAENVDQQDPPSQEELQAVRRKIDWRLMPIMVGTYGIQFYGIFGCHEPNQSARKAYLWILIRQNRTESSHSFRCSQRP